ncbi:arginine--tRNA ligase [Zavarzinia compransoris]|uniref:Arginine--tRNA ligase n=1 Tax=Zavarzinia compransoris TaxID=1264899 RepID=A0A317EBM7_9PROT|nr:arginine--tRNA ligase [Zavarzinia compransoris]PWR23656.1 arginine--tRNA ligase [Zavarzinia compransoris]TDP47874.1 arginyl-tRNA synthetase [Zavarzinia compransoris]
MTNYFDSLAQDLKTRLAGLAAAGTIPALPDNLGAVVLEPTRDAAHGDVATNAALVLSKPLGLKPQVLGQHIAEAMRAHPAVTEAAVAGPGFVNLRLSDAFWHERLGEVLAAGADYGTSARGAGVAVNVEYVSANPTGPLHVGHCRGAVFGDALAALLEKVGYGVAREYYINDAGGQVDTLARSAYLRYREALGDDIGEIPEGLYPGDYLVPVGAGLKEKYGSRFHHQPEDAWLMPVREFAIAAMMAMIREDLAALNIRQDVFFSEYSLHATGRIDQALEALTGKGLIYEGVLEAPKGKQPDDWEPRPQTLFKASEFGDDTDRPLKKSNGAWTYFAADIAYHFDKFNRGFNRQIDVWGADHGGYIKRMRAAVTAISGGKADLDVKICQLVKLTRGGEPVKMSKRSGSFVTLRDVVDEVGKDVVRFMMLTRKNDAPIDFDFEKVTEQSKDNPVFYVQYAHARARSVLRKAEEEVAGLDLSRGGLRKAAFGRLSSADELALVRLMAAFPRLLEQAAEASEPHRVAFALYDLAAAFHGLWNKGKEDPSLRFIHADDPELTLARLSLLQAVCDVIASGLGILGVTPVEEMR